jgi:hypothetical protein
MIDRTQAVVADAEKFGEHLMANYSNQDLAAQTIGAALLAALIAIQTNHKCTLIHFLQDFTNHARECRIAHDPVEPSNSAPVEWPKEVEVD